MAKKRTKAKVQAEEVRVPTVTPIAEAIREIESHFEEVLAKRIDGWFKPEESFRKEIAEHPEWLADEILHRGPSIIMAQEIRRMWFYQFRQGRIKDGTTLIEAWKDDRIRAAVRDFRRDSLRSVCFTDGFCPNSTSTMHNIRRMAEFEAKQESLRMWNFYIRQMEKLDELRTMQAAGVETVEDYWREYQLCSFYDAEVIELKEKEGGEQ